MKQSFFTSSLITHPSPSHIARGRFLRLIATILLPIQLLGYMPMTGLAAVADLVSQQNQLSKQTPEPVRTPQNVSVNRTLPKVEKRSETLRFSENPTDNEIFQAKLFSEALVPVGGKSSVEENRALANALQTFAVRQDLNDVSALTQFIEKNPQSVWRASLQANLADYYYHAGFFSKSLDAWEEAWKLSKHETEPRTKALADWSVGQLAEMNSRVGRFERLEPLLKEIKDRAITGPGSEWIADAKEGLWEMKNRPGRTFICGTLALQNCRKIRGLEPAMDETFKNAQASLNGFYLGQLEELSKKTGLNYQMVKKEKGASIPENMLPLVVHWKLNHYGALLKKQGNQYQLKDPVFGPRTQWISQEALDNETSGYFLVPAGRLPEGWSLATREEVKNIFGKGKDNSPDKDESKCDDEKSGGGGGGHGMAYYLVHSLLVSLHIADYPIGYKPPVGPETVFKIMYNQRESQNPANFAFANFGPKWTINLISYIKDNPVNLNADVKVIRIGGAEAYTDYDPLTQSYATEIQSRTTLKRTSSNPIAYERSLPDGSKEIFSASDGTQVAGRRVFLTQKIDAQGNTQTFTYDAQMRLVAITDAIGQVSTFSYNLPNDPYKITKITDPFGRFAKFDYNSAGQLIKITDVIGLTSEFEYGPGDFIHSLITPYGRTSFTYGEQGSTRWLEVTDPYGDKERVEYRSYDFANNNVNYPIPFSEPIVPSGMTQPAPYNQYLSERNTFYWNKEAMKKFPGDYTKASIIHWLNEDGNHNVVTGIKESEKQPLENRVWYNYPNQTSANGTNPGMVGRPKTIARVLDDGSTQLTEYKYNNLGKITNWIDPRNRVFSFIYASNGIDLTEVRQTKGSNNELLWSASYNSAHRPLTTTDASGQTTIYIYNGRGQITTVTNPKNEITTYNYDTNGYLLSIVGPVAGANTSFTYDNYGRQRTITDSQGYTLTLDYDALNRLTLITYPDGTFEQNVYDKLDLAAYKDRLERWSYFYHNALRQKVAEQDALGQVINYNWSPNGTLESLTDAQGQTTRWSYDVQSRLTVKTFADNTQQTYLYDSASRFTSMTDALGQGTLYQYFADNTLKQITYTNAINPTPNVSFTYSTIYNRLTSMSDGTGTTIWDYYPITSPATLGAGKLSVVNGPYLNDLIRFYYDELGRVTTRTVNNTPTTWNFDPLNRISGISNLLGSFTYTYVDATPRLNTVVYPNAQSTTYDYYDNKGDQRPKQIKNFASGNQLLSQFDYQYDANGTITDWTQQAGVNPSQQIQLQYDAIDQLLGGSYKQNGTTVKEVDYAYDKAGNRILARENNTAQQAAYNILNQLTSLSAGGLVSFHGNVSQSAKVTVAGQTALVTSGTNFNKSVLLSSGTNQIAIIAQDASNNKTTNRYEMVLSSNTTQSLSYDLNGNLLNDGNKQYVWDAADRLVKIIQGTNTTEFTYDGLSRRVRILEKQGGNTVRDNRFIWDKGENVEERNSLGSSATKRYYSQGVRVGTTNYYYTRDHLGSIREVTDSLGSLQARYDYDLYGNLKKISGSFNTDFGYTGHYYHQASGLVLTWYRAYDVKLGRWLSRDPIAEKGGINLYAYCYNNPVNYIDINGDVPLWAAITAGILLGAFILNEIWPLIDPCYEKHEGEHTEPDNEESNNAPNPPPPRDRNPNEKEPWERGYSPRPGRPAPRGR